MLIIGAERALKAERHIMGLAFARSKSRTGCQGESQTALIAILRNISVSSFLSLWLDRHSAT